MVDQKTLETAHGAVQSTLARLRTAEAVLADARRQSAAAVADGAEPDDSVPSAEHKVAELRAAYVLVQGRHRAALQVHLEQEAARQRERQAALARQEEPLLRELGAAMLAYNNAQLAYNDWRVAINSVDAKVYPPRRVLEGTPEEIRHSAADATITVDMLSLEAALSTLREDVKKAGFEGQKILRYQDKTYLPVPGTVRVEWDPLTGAILGVVQAGRCWMVEAKPGATPMPVPFDALESRSTGAKTFTRTVLAMPKAG